MKEERLLKALNLILSVVTLGRSLRSECQSGREERPSVTISTPWLLGALVVIFMAASAPESFAKNYLLIMTDDLGRDKIRAYEADFPGYAAAAEYLPTTTTIDSLASQGLRFTRAWANPLCSPTRAALQTGLHPNRNGIIGPLPRRRAGD